MPNPDIRPHLQWRRRRLSLPRSPPCACGDRIFNEASNYLYFIGSSDRDLACSSGGGNFSFNDAGGDVPFSNSGDARPAVSPSYLSSSGGGEELSFNGVIDNFLSSVAVPTTGPPAAAATSSPPALPAAAVAANSPSTSQQQPVFDLQQRSRHILHVPLRQSSI